MTETQWMALVGAIASLVLVAPAVLNTHTKHMALRNIALWLGILVALVAGYQFFNG